MNLARLPDLQKQAHWLALGLAAATFALFAPAIGYEYVDYDDGVYVYGNKAVLQGLTFAGVRYAFTSTAGGSWMPLTWLSHMLDVTISGPSAAGQHATNILLHSLSAGLLFLAFWRLTGCVWRSLMVAALFAFHPLRNESVVWVAERKDTLSAWFWMLGLLAYVHYVERPGAKRYALVLLSLALGLMAKPMLVTFPCVLLFLDFWPLKRLGSDWSAMRRNLWPRFKEKLPLLAVAAVMCGVTLWTQSQAGALNQGGQSLIGHLRQVAANYGFYLQKSFVPVGLTILHPERTVGGAESVLFGLLLAGVTGAVVWRGFRQPWLATGWFWFIGALVPVAGFVPIGHISVAERYSYIPSVGLALLIVWSVAEWTRARAWVRLFAIGAGIAAAAACLAMTRLDLPRWKDSLALFESALKVAPHAVTYNNLAVHYLDHGEYEKAIEPLNRAIELEPDYVTAIINRITAFEKTGRAEQAKADYARLLKVEPRSAEGYYSRAEVLLNLGRIDEAIRDFTAALQLDPRSALSYNNRASARFLKGDLASAIGDCTRALELNPGYANAYNTRANARQRLGDSAGALADYNRAIELSPSDPLAYNNRAAVHLHLKHYDKAWADLRRCRELGGVPPAGLVEALVKASGRSE